jgi:hypothetical protein
MITESTIHGAAKKVSSVTILCRHLSARNASGILLLPIVHDGKRSSCILSTVSLKSLGRSTERLQRPNGRGAPGFDSEFLEYFLHVLFDRGFGDAEDR